MWWEEGSETEYRYLNRYINIVKVYKIYILYPFVYLFYSGLICLYRDQTLSNMAQHFVPNVVNIEAL